MTAKKTPTRPPPGRPVETVSLPDETPPISEHQMRQMHALLRSRLALTERADILDYLAVFFERHVESRKDLTTREAAQIIAHLDSLPGAPYDGPSVLEALTAVMNHVRAIGKDSQAPANIGGFRFRGVDAIVNAVSPALRDAGVVVMPEVLSVERVTTQSRGGANMMNVYVTTRYTFHGPGGDSLSTVVLGEAADAGDKATAKAQSVALRVALLQALMLPTDEPDPDAEGYERGEPTVTRTGSGTQRDPYVLTSGDSAAPYDGPSKGESLLRIDDLAAQIGKTRADVTTNFRKSNGDVPVERLVDYDAPVLANLADRIAAHVEELLQQPATP